MFAGLTEVVVCLRWTIDAEAKLHILVLFDPGSAVTPLHNVIMLEWVIFHNHHAISLIQSVLPHMRWRVGQLEHILLIDLRAFHSVSFLFYPCHIFVRLFVTKVVILAQIVDFLKFLRKLWVCIDFETHAT